MIKEYTRAASSNPSTRAASSSACNPQVTTLRGCAGFLLFRCKEARCRGREAVTNTDPNVNGSRFLLHPGSNTPSIAESTGTSGRRRNGRKGPKCDLKAYPE
jgi:hypothetical protein